MSCYYIRICILRRKGANSYVLRTLDSRGRRYLNVRKEKTGEGFRVISVKMGTGGVSGGMVREMSEKGRRGNVLF